MAKSVAERETDRAVRDAKFEGRMDHFEGKLDELTALVKGIAAEIKTTQIVQFDVAALKAWQQRMDIEHSEKISLERFVRLESTVYKILWGFGTAVIGAISYVIFKGGSI